MMESKKKVLLNFLISTMSTFLTMALGFVLPRVIMKSWGSEYNGLVNSVRTIMNYLLLLEAGVSTSTLQALYKSVGSEDNHQTSVVVHTSQLYYRKLSAVYFLCILAISGIYPLIIKTTITYWNVFFVIFLQGCSGVINFAFRASYQQLLKAEGKYYIISLVTMVTQILTYAAKFVSVLVFNNIIVMQLLGVIIMGFQVAVYAIYFQRRYKWIDHNVRSDMSLLEHRKYYVVQQIGGLVFNSTDTFVLSIFCGLKVASVYTTYAMVYSAVSTVIGIVRSSTGFVLGQSYYQGDQVFKRTYNVYTSVQVTIGCILSSVSLLLITGFISLYTKGVEDIDYHNYLAAVLFAFNIILDCMRGANLAGANVAGQAPKTTWRYLAEAGINLFVSLILVQFYGMVGVLLGTVVAGIWRSVDSIIFFSKNVLKKNPYRELLFDAVNIGIFALFILIGKWNLLPINSYLQFVMWGAVSLLAVTAVYFVVFAVANRNNISGFLKVLRSKK